MATKLIHCSTTTMRDAHVVILGNQLVAGLGSQIAVGQAVIAKNVAIVPKLLDELWCGVAHESKSNWCCGCQLSDKLDYAVRLKGQSIANSSRAEELSISLVFCFVFANQLRCAR